jgi:hypothetical protein
MVKEFIQLVGYSNSSQKTLESNAILCVKIFGGKHRSKECTKKGIYACLVAVKAEVTVEEFWLHFNSSIYRNTTTTERTR